MCGIAGKVYFDRSHKVTKSELKLMTDLITHRGPDDEGFFIEGNVGIGFRRLSIIDLNTGHQPLSNEDGSIWIVFNGEIYNFLTLRDSLLRQGHCFKSKTDTEVIVHLYEQYGIDCLQYLIGMFSFAIYDLRNGKLFCARDRFGKKPFYYFIDNDRFIFGSEMKVILNNENIDKAINLKALDDYFAYGYIIGDKSIYQCIQKLPAAHYLEIDLLKCKLLHVKRYWNFTFEPDFSKTETQWKEEIIETLSNSVKMRMISDVPLGAFLSGGVDSSSIVALMAKNSSSRIKTFSIGFKEPEYNELDYARELARRYNTEHYEQIIEPESIEILPKIVKAYDEPFADSSAIPTYYVSKFAREYVTVVLSGDGGDELFAGYKMYSTLNLVRKLQILPDAINKTLFYPIYRILPDTLQEKKALFYLTKPSNELGANYTIWNHYERQRLYKKTVQHELNKYRAEYLKSNIVKEFGSIDFISKLQGMDIRTYLTDDILTKVDRASMMNSLEVRVPLLDHKFAEMTFKIPVQYKFHNGDKKFIFKRAMKEFLPEMIIKHKKQGFALPLKMWFRNDLNEYINDKLLNKNCLLSEYLDIERIRTIIRQSTSSERNFSHQLWSLLILECWLENSTIPVSKYHI
jgi:asparagine synthase (glutamine-hydrolysing)